ncbi:ORF MSV218 hypothetical protein [Melanoplus sanguinipes entomopoxvirus]|uniref:Uncharacterized protein n=1 Tax=Melanoplus sanguinipes entomopoxvirus TaxID=83191 RepID=Q9YVM4_MSEPV|nr:ORF MSV218 hypothetical protein [Melanoplus sanguinipes entomopoxvirus]AAC97747.1 ORF MSV218 hypothetical protein [Melanoplus sanguinipes entomopoxvirus 'O']
MYLWKSNICTCSQVINNPLYNIKDSKKVCIIHKNYYKKILCENYHLFNKSRNIKKYFDYILKNIFPKLSLESIIYIYNNELSKYINHIEVLYREYYTKLFLNSNELDENHNLWINYLKSTYSEYNFNTDFNNIKLQLFNPLKILDLNIPKNDHNKSGILFIKNITYNKKPNNIYLLYSCGIIFYNPEKNNCCSNLNNIIKFKEISIELASILYGKKINYKNICNALYIMYKSKKILKYNKYKLLKILFPNTYDEYYFKNDIIYNSNEYYDFHNFDIYNAIKTLNKYNLLIYLKLNYKSFDILNYLNIEVNHKNKIYTRIM